MDALLKLLKQNARESDAALAKMLNITAEEVQQRIRDYEEQGVIRGYRAVLDNNQLDSEGVYAVIELRARPERDGGFDQVAERIAKFPQVESMFLMSGAYDLLLFVKGNTLQELANFVSAHLSTLDGVLATSTHFMLKTYKDQGVLMESENDDNRLPVSP